MKISSKKIKTDGNVLVEIDIKNVGKCEGDEVVQLYIHDVKCSEIRPAKELRGFERVSLKAGELRTVSFKIPAEKLAFYDEKTHHFLVEPGTFEVLIGSSSDDIRLKNKISVVRK